MNDFTAIKYNCVLQSHLCLLFREPNEITPLTSILYHNFFSALEVTNYHSTLTCSIHFVCTALLWKDHQNPKLSIKCFIVLEIKDSIICKITCHSSCSNLWIATMYILMIYCLSQGSKSKCLNNFQTALIHVYAISDTKQNLTYMTCTTNMVNPFPLILVFFLLKHNYRLLWTY